MENYRSVIFFIAALAAAYSCEKAETPGNAVGEDGGYRIELEGKLEGPLVQDVVLPEVPELPLRSSSARYSV